MSFTPWNHQVKAVEKVVTAINQGVRRICLSSPTGTGKTRTAGMIIKEFLDLKKTVAFYTNRKLLLEQSTKNFDGFDLEHGVRASGHENRAWLPFQVCSIQTETSRLKKDDHELHRADLAIIDEAHINGAQSVQTIATKHVNDGAAVLGLTATPVDMAHMYDRLIEACTVSEGRDCGALVPVDVYGPDEPDLRAMGVKIAPGEDPSENETKKAMMTPTLFGRVWDWWNKLNPEHKPTIGFAPGKAESLWFAREFWRKGVSSAHIDGDEVWINGVRQWTSQGARDEILEEHRAGRIKIIWNFFVMREGIDLKWCEFAILATMFGSFTSFLQSVGRVMRACLETGKTKAVVIDHGGNWHRHGDPNADREWNLEYTNSIIAGLREENLRKAPEKLPVRCPKCALIITERVCQCGFKPEKTTYPRPVVQVDGTLKMMTAQIYRPRTIDTSEYGRKLWEEIYWGFLKTKKHDKTFREAINWFSTQSNWQYPDPSWPYYPKEIADLFRKIKSVPFSALNPPRPKAAPKPPTPPCPF